MPENSEGIINREQNSLPTDEELVLLIQNSPLPNKFKQGLEVDLKADPWIRRQLEPIYIEIDRVYNTEKKDETVINLRWEALKDDWKIRKDLPLAERK